MTNDMDVALATLAKLGFKGRELFLAELIPAVEMAWADGVIQPNERAMLESYCMDLVERLNREAGAPVFTLGSALLLLERLAQRRLTRTERRAALLVLARWGAASPTGAVRRKRMFEWAEAVAAVDGKPVWDMRELFWLQVMRRTLEPMS